MSNPLNRPDVERLAILYSYGKRENAPEILDLIQYVYRLEKERKTQQQDSADQCTCDGKVGNNDIYCPVHCQSCYSNDG